MERALGPASSGEAAMLKKMASSKKKCARVPLFHCRRFQVVAALIIVAISVLSLITWLDRQYSVEAKLLFLSRPGAGNEYSRSLLDREIHLLQSPEIFVSLHRNLGWYSADGPPAATQTEVSGSDDMLAHRGASLVSFGLSWGGARFCEWLQDNLEIEQDVVGSQARVKLSLTGSDPEMLSSVLNSYLKGYVAYRAEMESAPGRTAQRLPDNPTPRGGNDEISALSEQLGGLDVLIRNCSLVLKLAESGGVFSGLVTENSLKGLPSLSQFQDRIIQLEMQKRSLLVKFTHKSREVRAVESEIQGVRGAMRECLAEQVNFLKKRQEELQARKVVLESKKGPFRSADSARGKLCLLESRQAESWFCMRDGLCVIQQGPYVARRPIGIRTRECTTAILAFLSDWGVESPKSYAAIKGEWGVEAGAPSSDVSHEETGSSLFTWLRNLDFRWLYSSGGTSSRPDGSSEQSGLQPARLECSGSRASRR